MKHFFTIATLLTSVSAFAQLPYNPDADNNGTIGASDLTALLSVYGNGFSNGVLGEGSVMATLNQPYGIEYPYYQYSLNGCCSAFVVDLYLVEESFITSGESIDVFINPYSLFNGLTITFLVPSYWVDVNVTTSYDGNNYEMRLAAGGENATGWNGGTFQKLVWWNGEFLLQDSSTNLF